MRNLKKLVALIVTVALMVTLAIPAFAATPADVKGTDYEGAVSRLLALGMITGYPNGDFGPNDTITRAQVAAMVVRALGYEEVATTAKGATQFSDVAATHWAAGYINLAVSLQIINGYGDGKFGPDDEVTFDQAVAMIVRALGQDALAKSKGGFPSGYLVQGKAIGFTVGVKGVAGVDATRGIVAQLFDNAKAKAIYYQEGFGDSQTFKPDANDTFMARLGIKVRPTGDDVIVTKTPASAGLDANKFVAGGTTFTAVAGSVDVESLLGKKVDLWGSADDKIVLAENVVGTTVAVKTVNSFDAATSVYNVTLSDDTKKDYKIGAGSGANLNLEAGADVAATLGALIGVAADKVQVSLVVDADGNIQYVDAIKFTVDKVASAAVENKVAKNITLSGYYIKKDDKSIKKLVIVKDGAVVDYTAIAKDDILFVAFEENDAATVEDNYLYIKATSKTVAGTFEGADSMAAATKVKVEGTWYDVSAFKAAGIAVATGEVTLTLDPAGRVYAVAGAAAVSTEKYGVVVGHEKSTSLGDTVYKARILTASGDKIDYTVKNVAGTSEITNAADNAIAGDLVKYSLNSDGVVDDIVPAEAVADPTANFDTSRLQFGDVAPAASVSADVVLFNAGSVIKLADIDDDTNATVTDVVKKDGTIVAMLVTAYTANKSAASYGYITGFTVTDADKYIVDMMTKDGAVSYVYENAVAPVAGDFVTFKLDSSNKMVDVAAGETSTKAIAFEKLTAADASKLTVDGANYWYADNSYALYDVDENGAGSTAIAKTDIAANMEGTLYLVNGDIMLVVIDKM